MKAFHPGSHLSPTICPNPFTGVLYCENCLRHWFAGHCLCQHPPSNQYRDDHRRVFGPTVIDVLGDPAGRDYCRDRAAVAPFVACAGELIAEATERGQYVLFDEYAVGETGAMDQFLHTGAEVLTRPAWVAVLRELEPGWHFWTAYFKHKSDHQSKALRAAARRLLDFYTDGTLRVPPPDFRVWLRNGTRYRTNLRFGNLAAWGESGGSFEVARIPPW